MLTCPLHWLTGLNCPFCGAQRMVVALLHGQVAEAFWLNPALMVGAPLVGVWWLWRREITSQAALVIALTVLAWGVIRNIVHL